MQNVKTIACVNNAGFVMSFGLELLDIVNTGRSLIITDVDSGNYPINQVRMLELDQFGLAEGTLIRPHVRAVWGVNNPGDAWVIYQRNGQTATYDVTGTTLFYNVHLIEG